MNFYKKKILQYQYLRSLGFLICIAVGLSSCHWFPIKKNKRTANQLILRDSVTLDRLLSGETARVAFNTSLAANCEIRFWSQEDSGQPKKDAPGVIPCFGGAPKKQFLEMVQGLSTESLYDIEIIAWPLNASKNASDRIVVRENDGKGIGKNFIHVRLNTPLRTSEIHRYAADDDISIEQLKAKLTLKTGCQGGVPEGPSLFSSSSDIGLQEITSKGYGISKSEAHAQDGNRLRMYYSTLQNESVWQWSVKQNDLEYEFLSRQGAEIFQVKMTSAQTLRFRSPNLNSFDHVLPLDPARPLAISWSDDNKASIASVIVQVGHQSQPGAFYCVYAANSAQAVIAADQEPLKGLAAGFYDITVTLYSVQLQLFPGTKKPSWVIASYDWRAARVQKI